MGKHTPGPWAVHPRKAQVHDAHSIAICGLLWPTQERSEDETKANARLIAAAPDLLEACKTALYGGGTIAEAAEKCRAAIAKAEPAK